MKISIVVPAFNEEKLIGRTLQSIADAAAVFVHRGWEVERIVCDNNSTDRTAAIAARHGALVVSEPVNQIARARNRGASAASGDWLIFVDADSCPSPALFEGVARAIESGTVAAGGAIVRLDAGPGWVQPVLWLWNCASRLNRWMAGSFIFCETQLFREIGGFSADYYVGEEIDLSRRLKRAARRAGRRVVILCDAPLVTSARKARLYSAWEYLKFLGTVILLCGRPLRRREGCPIWYDGRR